jgi:hypothetical protein
METLPAYVPVLFILTTLLAAFFVYRAAKYSKSVLVIMLLWLAFQAIIGISGFYKQTDGMPPRLVLMLAPPLILTAVLFLTGRGRNFIDNLDLGTLTILHVVRLPVELVLLWLFVNGSVPQLMTFEGRNFDILSGITAPFIYYFGFVRKSMGRKALLAWNFICLALVLNIVTHGILSVPTRFQALAFEQPNVGLLYFPFCWLPSFVVPVVLFAHLTAVRKLCRQGERNFVPNMQRGAVEITTY